MYKIALTENRLAQGHLRTVGAFCFMCGVERRAGMAGEAYTLDTITT